MASLAGWLYDDPIVMFSCSPWGLRTRVVNREI